MRRVGALILAAGGSTRLGEPKQFLNFKGESLIRRIVNAAKRAGCEPIAVVGGNGTERLRDELRDCEVILNPLWERGIGSTIKCGVTHLRNTADAVVILACDQPFVSADHITKLSARHEPIAASGYANTFGIPALFDARYFDALATLPDDAGAKAVIEAHQHDVALIPFPEGAIDIDTRADYAALTSPNERA